ncbi:MAG TPA: MerR family transcriptional regulator [Patescibacteria group bacterium]|nr:MerR family transcriptional regulator [Patescibacteria group bacterium]
MYTISEAAARTGVGASLIRAWERRYGVIVPRRTPTGYRLYDDANLRTLDTMRELVDGGWTASEAARAILAGEVDVGEMSEGRSPPSPKSPGSRNRARLVDRFVASAASASPVETEAVLDEILASGSYEAVVDDLLLPAAAALGDAWASGRISVAAEHAASAAVGRRLAAIFQAGGAPGRVSVVVGLPPGARHELGALAFAAALRRRGVGVLYLGQDVPVDGWLDAVGRTRARAAVIGVVARADRDAAVSVGEALAATGVPLIAIGGDAATADLLPGGGTVVLPTRVVDAAEVVAGSISRRR